MILHSFYLTSMSIRSLFRFYKSGDSLCAHVVYPDIKDAEFVCAHGLRTDLERHIQIFPGREDLPPADAETSNSGEPANDYDQNNVPAARKADPRRVFFSMGPSPMQ